MRTGNDDGRNATPMPQIKRWDRSLGMTINTVEIATDGATLAAATNDGVHVFDRDGAERWHFATQKPVNDIAVAQNGGYLFGGTASRVFCLDGEGNECWAHSVSRPVRCVEYTDAGKYVVVGSENKYVYIIGLKGEMIFKQRSTAVVQTAAISDDGNFFVLGSGPSILFYGKGGHLYWKYTTRFDVGNLALSDTGSYLVANSLAEIYCLDARSRILWKHVGISVTESLAISPTNEYIICGTRDKKVLCYATNGMLLWSVDSRGPISSIAVAKKGQHILIGSNDGNIYLVTRHGRYISNLTLDGAVSAMAITPEGTDIMVASEHNTLYFIENPIVYSSILDDITHQLEEVTKYGIVTDELETKMERASDAFSNRDYRGGAESVKSIRYAVDEALKDHALEQTPPVQKRVKRLKNRDVDVAELEVDLKRTVQCLKQDRYRAALEMLFDIDARADELEKIEAERSRRRKAARAEKALKAAREEIKAVKSRGVSTSVVEKLVRLADEALAEGDADSAYSYGEKARRSAKKAERKHLIRMARKKIQMMEDLITDARQHDVDVKEAARTLRASREALKKKQYETVRKNADALEERLSRLTIRNSAAYTRAKSEIDRLRETIDTMGIAGIQDVSRAEGFLLDAMDMLEHDPKAAEERATRAKILIEKVKRNYKRILSEIEAARERLNARRQSIPEAHTAGGLIDEARFLLDSGAFRRAKGYIQKAERIIGRADEPSDVEPSAVGTRSAETPPTVDEAFEIEWEEPSTAREAGAEPGVEGAPPGTAAVEAVVEWEVDESESGTEKAADALGSAPSDTGTEKPTGAATDEDDMRICRNCGATIPPGFRFCGKCGTKLERICPQCKTPVPDGFMFCGKCGTKVD